MTVTDPVGEFATVDAAGRRGVRLGDPLTGRFAGSASGTCPPGRPSACAIDYLVHGWDVAVSVGVDPRLDEEDCAAVLRIGAA